ncbi:MAG: DUF481 domain-containing protein [Epsilonproteobacteria bacterium]|nr:MAG: DUF481 domain-containing protein [Campylobacterota bacterium]
MALAAIGFAAETDIDRIKAQIATNEAEADVLKKELAAAVGPEPDPLKTHVELGYIKTTGNTNTKSFSGIINIEKAFGDHLLRFDAEGYYSEDDGKETKNRWKTIGNYDYPETSAWAFNYLLGYERDKFSGFDSQFYTGPGVKWKAIEPPAHQLDLQGNVLYSKDDIEATAGHDSIHDYASFQAKLDYNWQINESFKFIQIASYRVDVDKLENYFVNSKTAVEGKIASIFSLGVSYTIDYKNDAPTDKVRTDKTFLLSLIIDYNPILSF